jgi:hypothetical protein
MSKKYIKDVLSFSTWPLLRPCHILKNYRPEDIIMYDCPALQKVWQYIGISMQKNSGTVTMYTHTYTLFWF